MKKHIVFLIIIVVVACNNLSNNESIFEIDSIINAVLSDSLSNYDKKNILIYTTRGDYLFSCTIIDSLNSLKRIGFTFQITNADTLGYKILNYYQTIDSLFSKKFIKDTTDALNFLNYHYTLCYNFYKNKLSEVWITNSGISVTTSSYYLYYFPNSNYDTLKLKYKEWSLLETNVKDWYYRYKFLQP